MKISCDWCKKKHTGKMKKDYRSICFGCAKEFAKHGVVCDKTEETEDKITYPCPICFIYRSDVSGKPCDNCLGELKEIKETEGVRQNSGKPMLSPIDPNFLLLKGKGLAIGQDRYKEKAFNKNGNVMKLSTGYDSLLRHILKFMAGQDCDTDDEVEADGTFIRKGDGIHHLAKASNCIDVMWHNRKIGDDRNK